MSKNWSPEQLSRKHTFLEGPAGSGNTTAGVARLQALLKEGVTPNSILVMVPQSIPAAPYLEALQAAGYDPWTAGYRNDH